jgi:hypothetical protein
VVLSVFYPKGRILWSFGSVVGEQAQPPALQHAEKGLLKPTIESGWMPMRISITKDWNRPYTIEWTERA